MEVTLDPFAFLDDRQATQLLAGLVELDGQGGMVGEAGECLEVGVAEGLPAGPTTHQQGGEGHAAGNQGRHHHRAHVAELHHRLVGVAARAHVGDAHRLPRAQHVAGQGLLEREDGVLEVLRPVTDRDAQAQGLVGDPRDRDRGEVGLQEVGRGTGHDHEEPVGVLLRQQGRHDRVGGRPPPLAQALVLEPRPRVCVPPPLVHALAPGVPGAHGAH